MASDLIDTHEKLAHALQYWKHQTFYDTYFKLQDVVESLSSDKPMVEARPGRGGRWTLCHTGFKVGSQEAILHTAAVWAWNSDLQTGNFIPAGEIAPGKVPESRMQSQPGNVCQLSYAVDTCRDKSLYMAQKEFEAFALLNKEFNRGKKKRCQWQLGQGAFENTYIFSAPMFARRAMYPRSAQRDFRYELHPWLAAVAADSEGAFFPHPERPRIFEASKGVLHNIAGCVPPEIQHGDLAWISFYVEYIFGLQTWNPSFVPVEVVRIGTVSSHLVGTGEEPVAPPTRQNLQAGQAFSLSMDFPMFSENDNPPSPVASGSRTVDASFPVSRPDAATSSATAQASQIRPLSSIVPWQPPAADPAWSLASAPSANAHPACEPSTSVLNSIPEVSDNDPSVKSAVVVGTTSLA